MPFELNFERYPWKEDLTIKIKLLKLEAFLKRLQKSWKIANLSIKKTIEAIKKTVWQEKIKLLEVEVRRQCVTGSKKYPVKMTLKEVELKIL